MTWLEIILGLFRKRKPPPIVPPVPPPESRTMLEAINAYRSRQGRSPFVGDACLDQQAKDHAADVFNGMARPHDGFPERLRACGKGAGGENWAEAKTPDEAVAMWATSAGHRANMLASYTYCGTSIVGNSAVMVAGNSATRGIILGKPIVDSSNDKMTFAFLQ